MKKVKKVLALLLVSAFVLCLLSSCGAAEERSYTLPKTLKITDEDQQTVFTIIVDGGTMAVKKDGDDCWDEDTYDENGNRTVQRYYELGELRLDVTYCYDEQGRMMSWDRYDLYEGRSSGKCSYDEAGKRTEEASYDEDGALRWRYVYAYDEKGNRVRADHYDERGKLDTWGTFEYDEAGRLLKVWEHSVYQAEYCHYAYTYDAAGRVLTDSFYNTDGSIFKQTAYTYDESGREVEKVVTYGEDGDVFTRTETVYEADGSRRVRRVHHDGTEALTIYRYGQGERVTEKGEYDERGMLGWWYVYSYDENGLPAKRTGRLSAGEEILRCAEVTEYQTVTLTEAQYKVFTELFAQKCGEYFS